MYKKLPVCVLVLAVVVKVVVVTQAQSLQEIKQNEVLNIEGEGFGSEKGTVCFESTQTCYVAESEGLLSWTDALIKIVVPGEIPAGGTLMIYDANYVLVTEKAYKLNGEIVQLSEGDYIVDGVPAGETLRIDAYGLGTEKGSVTFGDSSSSRAGKIVEWEYSYVLVEVPDVKDSTEVMVHPKNGNSMSADFKVLEAVTEDEFSPYQEYLSDIAMDEAWGMLVPREDVVVAVIDDGIYQNHPDLTGRLWENEDEEAGNGLDDDQNGYVDDFLGYNFRYETNEVTQLGSHGTMVAGIIGAVKDNEIGIAGIAARVKMMPLIACSASGCDEEDIVEAIFYAVDNGARVINLSLSGQYTTTFSHGYDEAIEYAYANNVLVVIAAGNGDPNGGKGYNLTQIPQSPVCNDEENRKMILGVGASLKDQTEKAEWSNYGECVDVYAPGEGVMSTAAPVSKNDALYSTVQDSVGTSVSAPMVAGLAAYVISAYPEISNVALYDYIVRNTQGGVLDAEKVVEDLVENYSEEDVLNDAEEGVEILAEEEIDAFEDEESEVTVFTDIEYSKYKEAIGELQKRGIVGGYADGTFKPAKTINRAEFMKILYQSLPSDDVRNQSSVQDAVLKNCFPDVQEEWFAEFVCRAKAEGIINGYTDGSFQPGQEINVAEALKITLNAFKIWTREAQLEEGWYVPFVEYAEENDLYLTDFTPGKKLRRGEMAELVFRMTGD